MMKKPAPRPLGEVQRSLLRSLSEHKHWYSVGGATCGWVWDTTSGTKRRLDALVKRGLVQEKMLDLPVTRFGKPTGERFMVIGYVLTAAGKRVVELVTEQETRWSRAC